jgi:hypothetical protein
MTSSSDLSNSMPMGQTLSTPLLVSNLREHEGDDECDADYYDEEEGCVACPLKIVVGNEELDEVSGDHDSDSSQPTWVVWYHALLFLQLGMVVFCMSSAEATVTMCLWWNLLIYVIAVFVSYATLYRQGINQGIKDCKLTCLAVLLAPDILVIISMGLMTLEQWVAAFQVMLGSILCLAIRVAVITSM